MLNLFCNFFTYPCNNFEIALIYNMQIFFLIKIMQCLFLLCEFEFRIYLKSNLILIQFKLFLNLIIFSYSKIGLISFILKFYKKNF